MNADLFGPDYWIHVRTHVVLAASALAVSAIIALPLGVLIARAKLIRPAVLAFVNTFRVIPSLAILMLMLPLIGLGFGSALVALVVLAIPPIVVNTDLGLRGVPFALVDSARGMGMTRFELARRVEWPLAFPVAFAGIRTASVEVIASATLAAFIGGGGLGEYITAGLSTDDTTQLLLGAISVAVLALGVDVALAAIARKITVPT
ncbi:MAG: ABC transporter permease [Vulcanimicrobiaceae bacterium]|jgi:osmoprotectant transport system permease protein